MKLNLTDIEADVYAKNDKGVYYVRLHIPELQLYINSITVQRSPRYPDKELWVQMPAKLVGRRWIKILEFETTSPVLLLFEDAALRAVDSYLHEVDDAQADSSSTISPPP